MSFIFNKDPRFSLELPDSWEEGLDDDQSVYTFIRKHNPVGAIQVSLAKKDIEQDPTEIECIKLLEKHFKRQGIVPKIETSVVDFGYVGHAKVVNRERLLMIWLFLDRRRYGLVTYNCLSNHAKEEIGDVENIISTLKLK